MALILAVLSLYLTLHQLFSPERLHALADDAVAGSGRSVRFSSNIGRSWLPRPTATLHNVVITKPGSAAAAVMVKEMRIGISWSSLWQARPEIEKWQLRQAEIELLHDSDGRWSLQDLWQSHTDTAAPGRLSVSDSRINIHLPERSYYLNDFYTDIGNDSNEGRPFSSRGTLQSHTSAPAAWSAEGSLQQNNGIWRIPQLHLQADSAIHGQPFSLNSESSLSWQPSAQTLTLQNIRLRADSPFHNLHLTAESPAATWANRHLNIGKINAVYTAGNESAHWNGSLALGRISLRPSIAAIDEFEINNNLQSSSRQTTFNLSGAATWQKNQQLRADIKLTTLQDNLGKAADPRFNSQLAGTFTLEHNGSWQTGLQGLFDRQPAALNAAYTPNPHGTPTLSGRLNLHKLALAPYWQDLQAQSGSLYPALLLHEKAPVIDTEITIGSLSMPGLQFDNLSSHLFANRERITLSGFRAGLYGGITEGGISMANTNPISYHLQQNAAGVHIRALLQDLFAYSSISGNGNAVIDLTARGSNRSELTRSLNGSLQLTVSDGAWLGIDFDNILQRASNAAAIGSGRTDVQTPFSRFSMLSHIENGIDYHENVELISPRLEIRSSGRTDLASQTLSENLFIHNARNRQAKPIPLTISGPIDNPSVTIDFQRLTYGMSTPEERRRALAETLREQWQWLNPRNSGTP
ncbi:AsmA family protein [Uruburuella testudinis]|uniref:AsmA family protein n=1 Tax=Uruburuella testudinis TaxID=1282863 RepID=A0ABY4DVS2_9NEIS|nr:AsmA family protein [Uruburuella testudinis]UOO82928.1 AsmA family protein [Uruburuella testudinis]